MHFALLGPLEVRDAGRPCPVRQAKLRDLLALLLINADRVVSTRELIAELWSGDPPVRAASALHMYLSRLRQALMRGGGEPIRTVPGGYRLAVGPDECDLIRFTDLSRAGSAALRAGEFAVASDKLRAALALWRGPAFADISLPGIRVVAAEFEERRRAAIAGRAEADLALGRHEQVITELRGPVAEHPRDERLAEMLMRALIATDRHAEAAAVYHELRDRVPLHPGAEMLALHRIAAGAVRARRQVPAQLPPDIPDFTGRARLVAELTAAARAGGSSLIIGPPGVGKTALAVHVAHAIKDHFPDGQLFLDLDGRGAEPHVLEDLLADLGLRPGPAPVHRFRRELADRRVLLLADNVGSAAQLDVLDPRAPGCAVLATARHPLGLGNEYTVDALGPAEATELLARIVGSERVRGEIHAAHRIVESCGRLPAALRDIAGRLAVHEHRGLAAYQSVRPAWAR